MLIDNLTITELYILLKSIKACYKLSPQLLKDK